MVGPPCGVAAVLWFKSLLSLRVDVCVPEGKTLLSVRAVVMSVDGRLCRRRLPWCWWLRGICQSGAFLKLPRSALQDVMMHIYGRDSVSPAPRALDHVLSDSCIVKLLPTKTRSGYFLTEPIVCLVRNLTLSLQPWRYSLMRKTTFKTSVLRKVRLMILFRSGRGLQLVILVCNLKQAAPACR